MLTKRELKLRERLPVQTQKALAWFEALGVETTSGALMDNEDGSFTFGLTVDFENLDKLKAQVEIEMEDLGFDYAAVTVRYEP